MSALEKIKNFVWPKENQKKAMVKKYYRNIGFFVVSTAVFFKFGRHIADQIYNQTLLGEAIRSSIS